MNKWIAGAANRCYHTSVEAGKSCRAWDLRPARQVAHPRLCFTLWFLSFQNMKHKINTSTIERHQSSKQYVICIYIHTGKVLGYEIIKATTEPGTWCCIQPLARGDLSRTALRLLSQEEVSALLTIAVDFDVISIGFMTFGRINWTAHDGCLDDGWWKVEAVCERRRLTPLLPKRIPYIDRLFGNV